MDPNLFCRFDFSSPKSPPLCFSLARRHRFWFVGREPLTLATPVSTEFGTAISFMKLKFILHSWLMVAGLCLLPSVFCLRLSAQGTAFTYNGRLSLNGALANGPYEMRFTLYDASTGGNIVGVPLLRPGNVVTPARRANEPVSG